MALLALASLWNFMPPSASTQTEISSETQPNPSSELAGATGSTSGFKVSFGLRAKNHGANWSGGVVNPAQVRAVSGWHLHQEDQLRPPAMWDLRLQMVVGEVAAKAVIVDLLTPEEQSVELFSRRAHFQFVPAKFPTAPLTIRPVSTGMCRLKGCRSHES